MDDRGKGRLNHVMNEYDFSAKAHLARARAQFSTGAKESLFYAALELRCGIESRLHEYHDGAAEKVTIKKKRWKIGHLGAEAKKQFGDYTKPVIVTFIHPETKKEIEVSYTPVTRTLQKIGQRLGDYIHPFKNRGILNEKYWTELQLLIETGIKELVAATSGTLLGQPCGEGPNKIKFRFEKGTSQFLNRKLGLKVSFKMSFELVTKDMTNNRIEIKPV